MISLFILVTTQLYQGGESSYDAVSSHRAVLIQSDFLIITCQRDVPYRTCLPRRHRRCCCSRPCLPLARQASLLGEPARAAHNTPGAAAAPPGIRPQRDRGAGDGASGTRG
ncbi:hypothetical protein EVAR_84931_1 [Eumeta japonica]|uniref:Uncharacterized protein n=1 Tax=Eumeta variegata TaxID=151549 RepID=A0A4C1VJ54_EUMVA|nr:hypothetical protein EVAR_84931_1 [Eumeta japonica]